MGWEGGGLLLTGGGVDAPMRPASLTSSLVFWKVKVKISHIFETALHEVFNENLILRDITNIIYFTLC